jgi:sugar fermentation stimulation protein A
MSSIISLYKTFEETSLIARKNRFSLLLMKEGKPIEAYLANTGKMEEFLVESNKFFVAPFQSPKFRWQVVSSIYKGNHVLLDTRKSNRIVRLLIERKLILRSVKWNQIRTEPVLGGRRFDILLNTDRKSCHVIEVKTCTLCHKGVALFPDAPSRRATHHIELMGRLNKEEYAPVMIFLIPNGSAHTFIPNFHTDLDFSLTFLSERNVAFKALMVNLTDPVSVDLDSVRELPVDYERARSHAGRRGSYILVIRNEKRREIVVGRLGRVKFEKGYYVYIGSGMGGVDARLKRHFRKRKKRFWHIDYLTPDHMNIDRFYIIRRAQRIEEPIAKRMERISTGRVDGFGATDSGLQSHLFFFRSPPYRMSSFIDILLDFKTFSDTRRINFH